MKTLYTILLSALFALPAFAQIPIEKKEVPAKVLKTFERKNSRVTEVSWALDTDTYIVDFTTMRGEKMQMIYDEDGRWLESKKFFTEKQLPSKIRTFVKKEYGYLKFKTAYYYQDYKREKHYIILMTDKVKGFDEPFTWEIWVNSAGKHITTFEPDIPDLTVGTDLPPDERFGDKVDETLDDVAGAAADEDIEKKDLPPIALNWLQDSYDENWIYREIKIREDRKLGTVYYVVMKLQGYAETWEHYFDYKGEFIKKERIDRGF